MTLARDIRADKRVLRARLLAARAERDTDAGAVVVEQLLQMVAARAGCLRGRSVAAYVPLPEEPGDISVLDELLAVGATVLLPITGELSTPLRWGWYAGADSLIDGVLGLRQPRKADPAANLGVVDNIVVPALAADRSGIRLGRGAGFYDRALVGIDPDRVTVLVHDDEVLDELPREAHDRAGGWVLTPGGGRRHVRPTEPVLG